MDVFSPAVAWWQQFCNAQAQYDRAEQAMVEKFLEMMFPSKDSNNYLFFFFPQAA